MSQPNPLLQYTLVAASAPVSFKWALFFRKWLCKSGLVLLLAVILVPWQKASAVVWQDTPVSGQYSIRIQSSKEAIKLTEQRLQQIQEQHQHTTVFTQSVLLKSNLSVTNIKLSVESLQVATERLQSDLETSSNRLKELKQLRLSGLFTAEKLDKEANSIGTVRDQQQQLLSLLQQQLALAEDLLEEEVKFQQLVQAWWNKEQKQLRKKDLHRQLNELRAQRANWLNTLKALRQQSLAAVSAGADPVNDVLILQAEEQAEIQSQAIVLVKLNYRFENLQKYLQPAKDNIELVITLTEALKDITAKLNLSIATTESKKKLLQQYLTVIQQAESYGLLAVEQKNSNEKLIRELWDHYQQLQDQFRQLLLRVNDYWAKMTTREGDLAYRQSLPLNPEQWHLLVNSIAHLPSLAIRHLLAQWTDLNQAFSSASLNQKVSLFTLEALLLGLCVALWRFLHRKLRADVKASASFSARALRFIADSMTRSILALTILALVGSLVVFQFTIGLSLAVLVWLGVVWFIFKSMITVARIVLLENTESIEGRDVKLFYIVRGTFVFAGIFTALIVLLHQLSLPVNVAGMIDRVYMIVLLLISYPLMRHSNVVMELCLPYVSEREYLQRVIRLLVFLLPLTIFSNAIIGLMGYVNLAWQIALIEGKVLLVFSIWLILKGILQDVMMYSSEWTIRRMANGWLWAQALLKPLQQLLLALLTFVALIYVGMSFGLPLDRHSWTVFNQFMSMPLWHVAGTAISSKNILLFIIAFSVVYWAAKWSREFSYRWFYNKVKDSGVRNSLAMFTQYGIVVAGFFLLLSVLGIDLTTITVVAAALSIGIAFGVRDIVNNVLSGLLLLIERPVRKGDWISVLEYEGEVTHIGLRAITIKTGNNCEVIVPNTETMIKAFSNWTREDSLIRDEFTLRVAFQEDPQWVAAIIKSAVADVSAVVKEPAVEVLITKVADSALELSVRYHIDFRVNSSRTRAKSEIIGLVWQALQREKVLVPYPQQKVYVQSATGSCLPPLEDPLPQGK